MLSWAEAERVIGAVPLSFSLLPFSPTARAHGSGAQAAQAKRQNVMFMKNSFCLAGKTSVEIENCFPAWACTFSRWVFRRELSLVLGGSAGWLFGPIGTLILNFLFLFSRTQNRSCFSVSCLSRLIYMKI